jgi:hypothetical protein
MQFSTTLGPMALVVSLPILWAASAAGSEKPAFSFFDASAGSISST